MLALEINAEWSSRSEVKRNDRREGECTIRHVFDTFLGSRSSADLQTMLLIRDSAHDSCILNLRIVGPMREIYYSFLVSFFLKSIREWF